MLFHTVTGVAARGHWPICNDSLYRHRNIAGAWHIYDHDCICVLAALEFIECLMIVNRKGRKRLLNDTL